MDNKIIKIIILALPVIALMSLTLYKYAKNYYGDSWKIQITGYDPRHILHGHYMNFRFVWNIQNLKNHSNENLCLCLTKNDSEYGYESFTSQCWSKRLKKCDAVIEEQNGSITDFSYNYKYFIPQSHAADLDKALRNDTKKFEVELSIHPDRRAYIKELYIDGMNIEEYVRSQPKSLK